MSMIICIECQLKGTFTLFKTSKGKETESKETQPELLEPPELIFN